MWAYPLCGNKFPKVSFENSTCWAFYCLRNRSAVAMICWVINHCFEVRCKVDQITSTKGQWFTFLQLTDKLIFYSTNYAQERIYFDSTRRKSQTFPNFQPSHKEIPPKVLTVTLLFTSISCCWRAKNDVTPPNVEKTKSDFSKVSKWRRNGAR